MGNNNLFANSERASNNKESNHRGNSVIYIIERVSQIYYATSM